MPFNLLYKLRWAPRKLVCSCVYISALCVCVNKMLGAGEDGRGGLEAG
jgi:hypothetical protein